jgi:CRP-like cAMP-binding protein
VVTSGLRSIVLFGLLSDETLADLEASFVEHEWSDGAALFHEGDECTGLHVVLEGAVKLFRERNGNQQITLIQSPGSAISTTPLLDHKPYPVSASSIGNSRTLFLPVAEFDRVFEQHSDFRRVIIDDLTTRHRTVLALLHTIALKPVIARVATLIVETATAMNALDGSREFEMLLPQEQLAHEVATTREGVARSLARLRREDVIEQHGSRIKVLDSKRLVEWSEATSSQPATTAVE